MKNIKEQIMKYKILIILAFVIILFFLAINTNMQVKVGTQSKETASETVSEDNKDSDYPEDVSDEDSVSENNYDEDDYSWLIPQADHEIFTDEEKKQIEADTLKAVSDVWELYEDITIDESLPSYSSGIAGFTKE